MQRGGHRLQTGDVDALERKVEVTRREDVVGDADITTGRRVLDEPANDELVPSVPRRSTSLARDLKTGVGPWVGDRIPAGPARRERMLAAATVSRDWHRLPARNSIDAYSRSAVIGDPTPPDRPTRAWR